MEIYHDIKLIWGDIIEQRRAAMNNDNAKNLNSEKDFLDVLNGYSFDDDQLAILLMELLIGGTDSSAVTAVWLLAELIKNEEILDKVRKEIENVAIDEGGNPNESRLSECFYFEACVKETLRVHIPVPFAVPHLATKTCKINNYTIPKDSVVLVNAWAIHLDPRVWEDAASFKPERFLHSKINFQGAHFEFLPFSAGNRMCPGRNVAVKGVQLVVASLVHYFDWSLPNGENPSHELDMSDKFGTSLKMENPFHLIPKLREHVSC